MPTAVKVAFRPGGKAYHFSPADLDLKYGEEVIVKTEKGLEVARVVSCPSDIEEKDLVSPLKDIIRIATDEDRAKIEKHKKLEDEYYHVCKTKARKLNLEMKIINAELSFDGKSTTFHFLAEQRVDFRQLVKELNTELKVKVELRQIGVRDEAKFIGGFGCCGQRLCCTQFMCDFDPVSIKMAKEQNLPLNPNKISGNCGRLMCCLKYENEVYKEFKKRAPRVGSKVKTPEGRGEVCEVNTLKESLLVALENGTRQEYPLEVIKTL